MKNHRFRRIFAIITLILIGGTIITGTVLQGQAEAPRITIAVDAGHGGTDGGAVAKDGTPEKDLNLSIAILLREELEKRGAEVILTRTADDDTDGSAEGFFKKKDLERRAEIGGRDGIDLFLSIHCNASTSTADKGFQVWYGMQNQVGERLAESICGRVDEAKICTRIRAVKQVPEGLYLFRTLTIPNLLIECGFLTNRQDLELLKSTDFQKSLCNAICDGIFDYYSGIK